MGIFNSVISAGISGVQAHVSAAAHDGLILRGEGLEMREPTL